MKTTEDLFKASEEIGQGDKSEIQGGREMRITEAQKSISLMRGYVNQVLDCLQEQKFQQVFEDGLYIERQLLPNYDAAIDFLIERGRTDLLESCREIYRTARKADRLLIRALDNYEKSGNRIGEAECLSIAWSNHIIDFWEKVVTPIMHLEAEDPYSLLLKADAEARQREKKGDEKAEAPNRERKGDENAEAPHRGRTKDYTILWLVENPDGHLRVLHQLTEGLKGAKFYKVIKAAILENWFERPPYSAIVKEFGDIGRKNNYYHYMGISNDEAELEQLRETLRSRHKNL